TASPAAARQIIHSGVAERPALRTEQAQSECLFVSRGAPGRLRGRVWPSSRGTSRSFVLASLRALHLDLRRRRRQAGRDAVMAGPAPDGGGFGCRVAGRGRSVVARPGSGLSEEPVPGV